jgi:hypothetical protein
VGPSLPHHTVERSESKTRDIIAAIVTGKVPYNCTNNVSVGPGASGKTQTRYSITGKGMMEKHDSTRGGDQERLLIDLEQGRMVAFDVLEGNISQLRRATRYYHDHADSLTDIESNPMEELFRLAETNASPQKVTSNLISCTADLNPPILQQAHDFIHEQGVFVADASPRIAGRLTCELTVVDF